MDRKIERFNNFKVNKKEMILLIMVGILIEILFYIANNGHSSLSYLGALLICIVSLGLDIKKNIFIFMLFVANQRILVLPNNDISLINIIMFTIVFKQVYFEKFRISYNTFFLISTFIIYSIIPSIIGHNFGIIIMAIKASLLILMLVNFRYSSNNLLELYLKCIMYFILGVIIMGIIGIIFDGDFVLGTKYRFSGSKLNNPNDFSMLVIFSMSLLLYIHNKMLINNKLFPIAILSLMFFGLITQSRTFVLGLAVIASFYLFIFLKPKFKFSIKIKNIIQGVIFLIIILIIMFTPFFTSAIDASLERILNPRRGDISGSRFNLWIQYYELLITNIKYLLFGVGSSMDILNNYGIDQVAHNFIIELIVDFGILGTLITYFLFYNLKNIIIGEHIKGFKIKHFIALMPMTVLLVLSLTRHSPLNISFIIQFTISCMVIFIENIIRSNKI